MEESNSLVQLGVMRHELSISSPFLKRRKGVIRSLVNTFFLLLFLLV